MEHGKEKISKIKPRRRRLWNFIFIFNFSLVLLYALGFLNTFWASQFAVLINAFTIVSWFLWAQNFFVIEIHPGYIIAPTGWLQRDKIETIDIDLAKTRKAMEKNARMLFFRIYSARGKKTVFMPRLFVNARQIKKALSLIEADIHYGPRKPSS